MSQSGSRSGQSPCRAPGPFLESPIPMPSRSVQPAGKRHSHGGYVGGADGLRPARLPARDARDRGHVLPGGGAGCGRCSKRLIRWALPSGRASGEAKGLRGDGGNVHRMLTCPGKTGAGTATAGPGARTRRIPGAWYGRARTGGVCARDGARPSIASHACRGDAGGESSRTQDPVGFRNSAVVPELRLRGRLAAVILPVRTR